MKCDTDGCDKAARYIVWYTEEFEGLPGDSGTPKCQDCWHDEMEEMIERWEVIQ